MSIEFFLVMPNCSKGKPARIYRNVACLECMPALQGMVVTPKRMNHLSLLHGASWEVEESIICPLHGEPILWLYDADLKPLPDLDEEKEREPIVIGQKIPEKTKWPFAT